MPNSLRASRTAATDRLVGLGHGTLCHRLQDVVVAAFRHGIYRIQTQPVKKRLPTPFLFKDTRRDTVDFRTRLSRYFFLPRQVTSVPNLVARVRMRPDTVVVRRWLTANVTVPTIHVPGKTCRKVCSHDVPPYSQLTML
jgi:hypothetical protein